MDGLVLCLSDELRLEVLNELWDSLKHITEEDLMGARKRMAVLMSNPMVHRNQIMVSYKEEIIRVQCVFGLRCKETQDKILVRGKGLPTLDAVITKAEAKEQAKFVQDKLSKRMRQGVAA